MKEYFLLYSEPFLPIILLGDLCAGANAGRMDRAGILLHRHVLKRATSHPASRSQLSDAPSISQQKKLPGTGETYLQSTINVRISQKIQQCNV